jgi:S-adenosylmethionine:tRNA ribosyltransferase-isomerase
MQVKDISIASYSYDLPPENIAYYPLAERDASKLLIYRDGATSESIYRNIGAHLPEGALLVFNNTKVVEARIVFQKPTGGQIEIFCLEPPPEYGGIAVAMTQTGRVRWKCLIGGASKWKAAQVLRKEVPGAGAGDAAGTAGAAAGVILESRFLGKDGDAFLIELSWSPAELSFAEVLHRAGLIPLPPYIRRSAEATDSERYQTIYARHDGSVAAPTAGLHFTEAVFSSLAGRDIRTSWVTLHVGAGTFLPVKAATLGDHPMHVEFITVGMETILGLRQALADKRPVVPVGTTSARTIESLYWLGRKTKREPAIALNELVVRQWDAYEVGTVPLVGSAPLVDSASLAVPAPSAEEALTALLDWMERRGLTELVTTTQLLITPGYDWKIAKGLITNFHQPQSTLLLLIASLVGPAWRDIYAYALAHGFRFLSYGDGCLLWGDQTLK